MRSVAMAWTCCAFGAPIAAAHAEPAQRAGWGARAPSRGAVQRAPSEASLPVAAPADASHLQLGVGAGFALGLGEAQVYRGDSGASGGLGFLQLSILPAYRLASGFALGLRASYGFELGSRGEASSSGESLSLDRNLWEAAAMLRYQADPGRSWYLVLSAGAAALVDSEGDASVVQWAFPAPGIAVGYDVQLGGAFAVGVEGRAAYANFSEGARLPRASSDGTYYAYDVSAWLGLAVVGTILR